MKFKIGTKVVCRGALAEDFSLAGVIEDAVPENPTGVYLYGVRLVNGNYKLFPPENVKAAGWSS